MNAGPSIMLCANTDVGHDNVGHMACQQVGCVLGPTRVKRRVSAISQSFCSPLAMRGAPARAIQDLAGHQDLTTTQRYMHLSPAAIESAIRLVDQTGTVSASGNIVATAGRTIGNALIQNE
jgi:Phage integrase family